MWFLVFVLTFIVFKISPSCSSNPDVALIHHPEAAFNYYQKMNERKDCACMGDFKTINPECRKNICLDMLVNAVSYSLPPDNTDYVTDDFDNKILQTYEHKDPAVIYQENFTFTHKDKTFEVPAQMCILQTKTETHWAVSAGYHRGILLVFTKPPETDKFQLFGLLEKMPYASKQNTEKELDIMYTEGQRDVSTVEVDESYAPSSLDDSVSSLCDLDDFQRFRVCATTHMALMDFMKEKYPEGNYITSPPPIEAQKCIRDATVLLGLYLGEESKKSVKADLLPCSINKDWQKPQFFVTSDPYSADSLFISHPIFTHEDTSESDHSIGDQVEGFRLVLHVHNVKALETFNVKY